MKTQTGAAPGEWLVEIRNLHVIFGDGRTTDLRSVRCPVKDRAVPVEDCLSCASAGRVVRAPHAPTSYVACHGAAGEPPARPAGTDAAARVPVHAVMEADVLAVAPDVSLEALTGLLLERGIGGAPVVDGDGRPVGMISKTDLISERLIAGDTEEALGPGVHASRGHYRVGLERGFHAEALPRTTVADAMTRSSITVAETAPVGQAAALLALRGIHRVPVVSEDGRVAGLITSTDLVRWLAEQSGFLPKRGVRARAPAPRH